MHIYFKKEYQVIRYDKVNHILLEKYLDTPPSYEFLSGMEAKISAMRHFMTGKLISDVEQLSKIPIDGGIFSAASWLQNAIAGGVSHVAISTSEDMIYSLSLKDILNQTNVRIQYFNSVKPAIDWLRNDNE